MFWRCTPRLRNRLITCSILPIACCVLNANARSFFHIGRLVGNPFEVEAVNAIERFNAIGAMGGQFPTGCLNA